MVSTISYGDIKSTSHIFLATTLLIEDLVSNRGPSCI